MSRRRKQAYVLSHESYWFTRPCNTKSIQDVGAHHYNISLAVVSWNASPSLDQRLHYPCSRDVRSSMSI